MKKVVLFLLMVMLLSGCTIVRINTSSIDTIIEVILTKDNTLYNRVGRGYKYYVPRGVTYIDTNELNDKLYSKGNYYYLYVDTISYYYNIEKDYNEKSDIYYSRKLSTKEGFNHNGYIEIEEKDKMYYITFVYNYAKIETVVDKDSINDAVLDSSYILSTIQFNKDVIELTIDSDKLNNREEKYDVFGSKEKPNEGLQVFGQ